MSKYLFVKYNDNWADEMDITGFVIVKPEHWTKIQEEMKDFFKKTDTWSYCIGTNEDIEYNLQDWLRTFTITELSDEEATALIAVFKRAKIRPGYDEPRFVIEEGFFPIPNEDEQAYVDVDVDYEDEDDDEDYDEPFVP